MAETARANTAGPAGLRDRSEEALLIERLKRLSADTNGYFAVHVHLSNLRPGNKQSHFLDIAKRAFDYLLSNTESTLFTLSNCDMVLLCRNVKVDELDDPITKVRGLFREDPLTQVDEAGFEDRFASWYDLSSQDEYGRFYAEAETLLNEANERARQQAVARETTASRGEALTPANLAEVNRRLMADRVADLIREQPVVQIKAGGKGEIVFKENFIAINELRDRVAPGINLFASPWLFQFLTENLDRRVLAVMAQRDFSTMRTPISLNLNVTSVLSREFQQFHQAVGTNAGKFIIEMQVIDIFADMSTFNYARDQLQGRGYRVLVDGLNPLSIHFFDPAHLKADFIKISWGPEFSSDTPDSRVAEAREVIDHTGRDAVVLSRIDDEKAIRWGVSLGITRFQGHFIDKLVAVMAARAAAARRQG